MNKHIIFESSLILFTKKKIIKISPCFSKLQLAKVGAFFETVYCDCNTFPICTIVIASYCVCGLRDRH